MKSAIVDKTAFLRWGCAVLDWDPAVTQLEPVPGDASFRRYFRLRAGDDVAVLCDAPPATEKNREFVAIASLLATAELRVPRVFAVDYERGWLCLEDLGDQLLLPLLDADSVDGHYRKALRMLERLAQIDVTSAELPQYDRERLQTELDLFPEWFCASLLERPLDSAARGRFEVLSQRLTDVALAQTAVVVHRDFHARNLMLTADGDLAAIDFQDAVLGPVTYDLVSLLRDCYMRWPDAQVDRWALGHRDALLAANIAVPANDDEFLRDFDLMGLQRHIKVLGIFARLYKRDGKAAYLKDLPRVLGYTRDVLARHAADSALRDFHDWFEGALVPRLADQAWYTAP